MSDRRRMLLAIANAYKWLPYNYTNLYHDLVPITIDSKQVKNKAKVKKIYGNGVVENQLCPVLYDLTSASGVVFTTSKNGRKATLSGTPSSYWVYTLSFGTTIPIGRKVLVSVKLTNPNNLNFGYRLREVDITPMEYAGSDTLQLRTLTTQINCIQFYGDPNHDYTGCEIEDVQLIDLTHEYGAGKEPTSLTDKRIQAILNRGYIPYNTGTYKGTNVGGFVSEPYNLADNNILKGWWQGNVGQTISFDLYRFDVRLDAINVVPSTSYTLEFDSLTGGNVKGYIVETDENDVVVKRNSALSTASTITTTANTFKVYLYFYEASEQIEIGNTLPNLNISLHRTGTRTGYAPHNDFAELAHFNPIDINGIHDTFLASDTGYTITRKIVVVDLGSLSWSSGSSDNSHCFQASGFSGFKTFASNEKANIVCARYITDTSNVVYAGSTDKTISISSVLRINDSAYNNTTDLATFKTALSGVLLYYELATYQVINMPLRHLAMVDLGTLDYVAQGNGRFVSSGLVSTIKPVSDNANIGNIYCSGYLSVSYYNISTDMSICVHTSGNIYIQDSSKSNMSATDFKTAMSGVYLYYETADVVDETGVVIYTGQVSFPAQVNGALSVHDTIEKTKTEWVFTKNVGVVDLGTITFSQYGSSPNYLFYGNVPNGRTSIGQGNAVSILCSKYTCNNVAQGGGSTASGTDKLATWDASNSQILIKDTTYADATAFNNSTSGIILAYEFKTPQVISIPRKHLGIVDLGTLTYNLYSSGLYFTTVSNMKSVVGASNFGNIYCSKYLTQSIANLFSNNECIACGNNDGYFYIKSSELVGLTTAQVKEKLSGIYLFYETNADVADFDLKMDVESGGTINAYWFKWVENQLVIANRATQTTNDITFTNNGDGTITATGTATAQATFSVPYSADYPELVQGHKYYFYGCADVGSATTFDLRASAIMTIYDYKGAIGTASESGKQSVYILVRNGITINATFKPQLIDLTKGFGAGNEPTDVNDPRIQYIIEHGYIPTNTVGTEKFVDCEALPNVDLEVKCK